MEEKIATRGANVQACGGRCQYAGLVKGAAAFGLDAKHDDIAEREDWVKERQGIRGICTWGWWMQGMVRENRSAHERDVGSSMYD